MEQVRTARQSDLWVKFCLAVGVVGEAYNGPTQDAHIYNISLQGCLGFLHGIEFACICVSRDIRITCQSFVTDMFMSRWNMILLLETVLLSCC